MRMILAIDIGNTNINAGVFRGQRLIKRLAISTHSLPRSRFLRNIAREYPIEEILACSVVPSVTCSLEKGIKKVFKKRMLLVDRDIKIPIKNKYRKPKEVGQDRLVNAFCGVRMYGSPLIVIDFGTAITFDVVSHKREYLGGMIIPGLHMSLESLAADTALLPSIELTEPKEFIGRDTRNSMLSGIIYGFAALTDDLVVRIKRAIGPSAKVVGTGGDISVVAPFCRQLKKIDKDLTLKGLNALISEK